ncbi:hypothetical protein [Streptacidiphilus sp. PAMC 29251]
MACGDSPEESLRGWNGWPTRSNRASTARLVAGVRSSTWRRARSSPRSRASGSAVARKVLTSSSRVSARAAPRECRSRVLTQGATAGGRLRGPASC